LAAFQDIPHLGIDALHQSLGGLDVVGVTMIDEPAHDERLEELEGHPLW
jgi:hypothetical protein